MSKSNTCVLRPINGDNDVQFVPVSEVAILNAGERVFIGSFNEQVEHVGPSKSHARTVCLPIGELSEAVIPANALVGGKLRSDAVITQCVVREVKPGDSQFRPVGDVDSRTLKAGETLFTGVFRTVEENNGPYGSHKMLIALPLGEVNRDARVA
jgi:hypothetical protein